MGKNSKIFVLLLALLLIMPLIFQPPSAAKAQNRTIIVPDDYPTIQAALGNSSDGDVIFFRNGTYEGEIDQTLVIDKSISLIGQNSQTTLNLHPKNNVTWILTSSYLSSDDALLITANNVKISNLTIAYTGEIRVSGERVQFINTKLRSHSTTTGLIIKGSDCNLTDNLVRGSVTIESNANLIFTNNLYSLRIVLGNNNTIESNKFHYLSIENSNYNFISKNSIDTENFWRVVDIIDSSYNTLVGNNVTSHLWNTNIVIGGESFNNTIYENNFLSPAYNVLNSSDYFYSNKKFVVVDSESISNNWEQNGKGNYWANYHGSDSNWDGIGDSAYIIDETNEDPYPLIKLATYEDPYPTTKPTNDESEISVLQNLIFLTAFLSTVTTLIIAISILLFRRHRRHLM